MNDTIPPLKNHQFIILNLGKRLGTHWVGAFKRDATLIYFDSFGVPVPPTIEKLALSSLCNKIEHLTRSIQQLTSKLCGYYTMFALDKLSDGKSLADIGFMFGNPAKKSKEKRKLLDKHFDGTFLEDKN